MNEKTKIEQVIILSILYNQKNIHVNIFFKFQNITYLQKITFSSITYNKI